MKELLVKDYRLLMSQKKVLFVLLGIMFFMVCFNEFDKSFLVGYMMMISVILSAGTVDYDDADNGMAFLMTLPATRRTYAVEKYVLTFINALFCGLLMLVLFLATQRFLFWGYDMGTKKMCLVILLYLAGVGLLAAVLIPLYLKFSVKKRRIVIIAGAGITVALLKVVYDTTILIKLAMIGTELRLPSLGTLIMIISVLPPFVLTTCGVVAIFVCIAISVNISIRIMEKKEF